MNYTILLETRTNEELTTRLNELKALKRNSKDDLHKLEYNEEISLIKKTLKERT